VGPPLWLVGVRAPEGASREGRNIADSSMPGMTKADLRREDANGRSPAGPEKESVRGVVGLEDMVELVADEVVTRGADGEGEGEGEGESEENTDPNTRFAFSREASLFKSMRVFDCCLGLGEGDGRRSKGTKPTG
jgi:hypothetical protein